MNAKKDSSNKKKQGKTEKTAEKNEVAKATESSESSNDEPLIEPDKSKEATPPHELQLEYWRQDLRLKKFTFRLSIFGFFFIITGILFNAYQTSISTEQLELHTKQVQLNTIQSEKLAMSLCYNLHSEVLSHVITLDRIFLERTYLRPYFYENKLVEEKDKYHQEAAATAELVLDVFDMIADQNEKPQHKECWDDAAAWDNWVIDIFSNSPILRETMAERRDWYANNLWILYEKAVEKNKNSDAQKAESKSH